MCYFCSGVLGAILQFLAVEKQQCVPMNLAWGVFLNSEVQGGCRGSSPRWVVGSHLLFSLLESCHTPTSVTPLFS